MRLTAAIAWVRGSIMEAGYLGVGAMGQPMAHKLLEARHSLTVYDISEAAMQPLLERQARRGASPRDLADRCEIVFVSLPTLAVFREVAFGADGLIHGNAMKLLVNTCTVGVPFVRELAETMAERGITVVSKGYFVFDTALGFAGIVWSDTGITRFQLPSASAESTKRNLLRRAPDAQAMPPPHTGRAADAVRRYFAGEKIDFADVPLDLTEQDDLFREIYAAARRLGYGETTTYGGLAKAIGRTDWEAAQEVGRAMANNPVALIIPCHRVGGRGQNQRLLTTGRRRNKGENARAGRCTLGPKQQSLRL
jgi:methylated-DNA-[protein]-cysteine S-methyltransferase